MKRKSETITAYTAFAIALGSLTGCDKHTQSGETVGQKVDQAIDRTNEAVKQAGDTAAQAARDAELKAKDAATKIEKTGKQMGTVIDDSAVTAAIKAKLIKDPAISAFKIDVNTVKGEVTLRGDVTTQAVRENAEQAAAGTLGVVKVNNLIRIEPSARRRMRTALV